MDCISSNPYLQNIVAKWQFASNAVDHKLGSLANSLIPSNSTARPAESKPLTPTAVFCESATAEYRFVNGWLCFIDEKGATPLCNCYFFPTAYVIHKYKHGSDKRAIQLCISEDAYSKETIEVNPTELDSLDTVLRKQFPFIRFNTTATTLKRKLADYVATSLRNIQKEIRYHYCGWVELNGKYVYLDDSHECCEAGKRIHFDPNLSRSEAFRRALDLLRVAEDQTKILVPFLVSYLGCIFTLFDLAGVPPRFVTAILGETNSLKTEVSRVLFNLYKEVENRGSASFKDTIGGLEKAVIRRNDSVLLIDDWHPPATSAEEAKMKTSLEKLIRWYGDGVGVNRFNDEAIAPSGCAVITGEDTSGSLSSLLRCVFIDVNKKTYNGEQLAKYQGPDNYTMSTDKLHFIKYVEDNFKEIIGFIKANFPAFRAQASKTDVAKRLVDSMAILWIMARILIVYGREIGVFDNAQSEEVFYEWRQLILETIVNSSQQTKEMIPMSQYLVAIDANINNQSIAIASSRSEYAANIAYFYGFLEEGYLYLKADKTYKLVADYWRSLNKHFSMSIGLIHKNLFESKVLRTQGKAYLYKISIDKERRVNMLAIDVDQMQKIISSL